MRSNRSSRVDTFRTRAVFYSTILLNASPLKTSNSQSTILYVAAQTIISAGAPDLRNIWSHLESATGLESPACRTGSDLSIP